MDEGVSIQIGPPTVPDFVRPSYANSVNVTFTPHDFLFVFSQLSMPIDLEPGSERTISPTAQCEVIIPASVMNGLIDLLKRQLDAYLENFGLPGNPGL